MTDKATIKCPYCGSANITNKYNGQEYWDDPSEIEEDDELYVASGNDWYDGPVNRMDCDNGHTFYLTQENRDERLAADYDPSDL